MKSQIVSSALLSTFLFLLIGCKKEKTYPAPVANFDITSPNTIAPAKITFVSTSTNADSYSWSFGDGSSATGSSVSHVYFTPGNYTIKLTASGNGGTHSLTKAIAIAVPPSQVKIIYYKVLKIPFLKPNGVTWDADGYPDVYLKIVNGATTYFSQPTYYDNVQPTQLPFQYNFTTSVTISPLNSGRYFQLYDYDAGSSDELIGEAPLMPSILVANPDDQNNPYPGKTKLVSLDNKTEIEIGLQWQ